MARFYLVFNLLILPAVFGFPWKVDPFEKRDLEPDAYLDIVGLIQSKGYPAKEYEVQTEDGYILRIQRIPPVNKKEFSKPDCQVPKQGYPILLQHGLYGSGVDYVINFPDESLGYHLSDCGYDVWIGNVRGNTYGRQHVNLTVKDEKFWQFSFDEMALLDLPAMIDFILKKTGEQQLYYVGHSQGTTMAFALLSSQPAYNEKIKLFVALAPVSTVGYIKSPIRYLAPFAHDLELMLDLFGHYEMLTNSPIMNFFAETVCTSHIPELCNVATFLFHGSDSDQFNVTRLPVYLHHTPAGTSTQALVHYAQLVDSKTFVKFDWGKKKNQIVYGQDTPPAYDVTQITAPVALFWAINDDMADPIDVILLKQKLKNVVYDYRVPDVKFNHIDFAYGYNATACVYNEVMTLLRDFF